MWRFGLVNSHIPSFQPFLYITNRDITRRRGTKSISNRLTIWLKMSSSHCIVIDEVCDGATMNCMSLKQVNRHETTTNNAKDIERTTG